ncbi:MAG: cytochrome c oxidase subunit II [Myxococcota bacterium]
MNTPLLLNSALSGLRAGDPSAGYWFPEQASQNAELVDDVYFFIYWVSIISFVIIVALMMFFVRRYKRSKPDHMPPKQSDHNTVLEIGWSIPVAVVGVILFYFGAIGYIDAKTPPNDAYTINVRGYKWAWEFSYPNGATTTELFLPADTPVKLVMSSDDVIHSFFVPAFRLKQDVVPGRFTEIFFETKEPGIHHMFCTEYCGTSHSLMGTQVPADDYTPHECLQKVQGEDEPNLKGLVRVLPLEEFNDVIGCYSDPYQGKTPEESGLLVYQNNGCIGCHSIDGSKMVGPSFKGLWGNDRKFADGTSEKADENYIRNSILNPKGQVVAGYQPVMPTYQGRLSDEEIQFLIAYFKTLK